MARQVTASIRQNESVGGNYYRMVLAAPELADAAEPGQFVQVRCGRTADPLLRRPLSLHGIDRAKGEVSLLYAVVGRGTELLSRMVAGEKADLIGPLGRGFRVDPAAGPAVLVGGGIGVAPLPPLAAELTRQGVGFTALVGARTAELLWEAGLEGAGELFLATDDGSRGERGLVTAQLARAIEGGSIGMIYACGPRPMLREVARLAAGGGIPCQLSLEEQMGCGIGACLSCVCKVKIGTEQDYVYQRVCTEGPVFWATEVIFDD